jgi:hypothetical protein
VISDPDEINSGSLVTITTPEDRNLGLVAPEALSQPFIYSTPDVSLHYQLTTQVFTY